MAYVQQHDDEEDLGNGPAQTSAQSSVLSGGQQTQAPTQANTPDKPGNFVGIKTYLDANKKQAGTLGNQIGGVIQNSANQARQGVQNLNNQFNQKAGSAVGIDQDALKATEGTGALSDAQKQTLKNQLGAQYGGPGSLQELDEYGNVNKNIETAAQNLKGAGTEEGRKSLIGQVNNKARTAGMTNFDSALVQSGAGRQNIANAVNANKDAMTLDQKLAQDNAAAQQKAQEIAAQDEATRNATSGAINTNFAKLYDALGIKQKSAQDKQQKDLDDLKKALMANDPKTANAQLLGLDPGTSIYDINLGDYAGNVTPGDVDISLADVAGDDEAAKLNALNELVNQSNFNLGTKEGTAGVQFGGAKDLKDRISQAQKDYAQTAKSGLNYRDPYLQIYSGMTTPEAQALAAGNATPEQVLDIAKRLRANNAPTTNAAIKQLLDYADKYAAAVGRKVGGASGDKTMGVS